MQKGTIVIDMSSIAPGVARRLAARARSLGGLMLDAPVSGGDIGAINGTLSIMVGGDAAAFAEVKPLLGLPDNMEAHAILPVGWPVRKYGRGRRQPVAEITSREKYGVPWAEAPQTAV